MKRALVVAAGSILIVAGACGSGGDKPTAAAKVSHKATTTTSTVDLTVPTTTPTTVAPPTTVAKPTVTTARVTTPTSAVASVANVDLESKLLKNLPAGYVQLPDEVGDTGPSDLGKAVVDDGESDALAVLTADGFVKGYQRLWMKDDGSGIVVFIYQFATEAGAKHYDQRMRNFASSDDEYPVTQFALGSIPGAIGFNGEDEDGITNFGVFTRGGFLGQVIVFGADANPAFTTSLAQQLYNNLA